MLCGALAHLLEPLFALKFPKTAKMPIFSPSALHSSAFRWPIANPPKPSRPAWPKPNFCKVSFDSVNIWKTFVEKTDERRGTPHQSKGRFATWFGGLRPQ